MRIVEDTIRVGDIVKVNVLRYIGFRGTVVSIEDGVAEVEVPCYYCAGEQSIIVRQDAKDLKPVKKVNR